MLKIQPMLVSQLLLTLTHDASRLHLANQHPQCEDDVL